MKLPHLLVLPVAFAWWAVCLATAGADDPVNTRPVRISANPSVTGQYVPGRWTNLVVNATNETEVDHEETIVVSLGENSNLQYARRVWVPARSSRQAWLPVEIPDDMMMNESHLMMRSMHVRQTDSGEQFQSNAVGMPVTERSLMLSWASARTAVFLEPFQDFDSARTEERTLRLNDAILAGRDGVIENRQDAGLIHVTGEFLCSAPHTLDSVDQIVIASDKVLRDTMAVNTIRQWLRDGGRLWVMVDQVPQEAIRNLLGDFVSFTEVDRVELNEFEMTRLVGSGANESSLSDTWESDEPAELVRVLVDDVEVRCHIDGWPAAFWVPVGNGEVLFTTLATNGWLNDQAPTPGYSFVASQFFSRRVIVPDVHAVLQTSLEDQIGYTIPSRSVVTATLGAHVGVVMLLGVWLVRHQKQNWLAAVIPVAALTAGGTLVAMGVRQTTAVPSTLATSQLLQASADSPVVQVKGSAATYSQETRSLSYETPSETMILKSDESPSSEVRRVLWTDDGSSQWFGVTQPPGVVRLTHYDSNVATPQPWIAFGRFTEKGFEANVPGLNDRSLDDPLVYRMGSPPLALANDEGDSRTLVGAPAATLSAGQFSKSTILSDEQRARQTTLKLLSDVEPSLFSTDPTLLAWTDPLDSVLKFDDDLKRRGSALAMIPIQIEKASRGSRFLVPSTFVRFEMLPSEVGSSAFFNARTGKWLEQMNRPASAYLRCMVPKPLLPCTLDSVDLSIRINAPSRTLQILGRIQGEFQVLFERENPSGLIEFTMSDADALDVDSGGGLPLGIRISATEEELRQEREAAEKAQSQANEPMANELANELANEPPNRDDETTSSPSRDYWNIEYIHVHLQGVTQ